MADPLIRCRRCGRRASGVFRITKADGSQVAKLLCASCAFNPPSGTRYDLLKTFSTTYKDPPPKPVIRADEYTKRVVESQPMTPWRPNYGTMADPNPHWIRSLRENK